MSQEFSNAEGLSNPKSSGLDKRNLLIEQLEERVLFDAVPVMPVDMQFGGQALDATAYVETANSVASDGDQSTVGDESTQIVFVDKSVDGYQEMVRDILSRQPANVFFINAESDGLDQMTRHLDGYENIDSIHIISHGNEGQLRLGNATIEGGELASKYGVQLARIGASLSANGDILIYGCDLASNFKGEAFIAEFSQLTNADVAASDDLTGSADQVGDWDLEKQVGHIETKVLSANSFQGTLLETDAGFDVGTSPNIGDGEVAITPMGHCGTSSLTFANAATANSGAISIDVRLTLVDLGNDVDPEGKAFKVTEINGVSILPGETMSLPSGAKVTLNGDNTVTYDPNGVYDGMTTGQSALDTFSYTIEDDAGQRSTAESVITINGENDPPIAEDDFVRISVDSKVTVTVLSNDFDPEGDNLAVILLNHPTGGSAVVNPDGTITFTPDSGFEGTVNIHYLVEDPSGETSEATLTIEVEPEFAFDSFTNFSQTSFGTSMVDPYHQPLNRILSQQIFALAPEPIFSGYARPRTQIVGRIYNATGALIGESSSITEPGGNWMIQFQVTQSNEFYRIEFEQVAAAGIDVYGYLGLNPADNTYQSMEPMTVYHQPLSVEGATQTSLDALLQANRTSHDPLEFGR